MTETVTPRVWVGCLSCYNEGRLTGEWVDAIDAEDFTPCRRTEYGSPHEEWWVMDFEGFSGLLTGECSPMEATRLAQIVADVESEGGDVEVFAAYCAATGEDPATASGGFHDHYHGEWDSFRAYAENFAEECGYVESDDWPYRCIDWDAATRELAESYWTHRTDRGTVHVFFN